MGLYDASPIASTGQGAASGAAVGSVIPGIGTGTGALVGAGLGLIGSLLGYGSQKEANEANIRLGRETNALNYRMFQESQNYQTNLWNKTNVYNSPLNQRRLLEQAGYNPALYSNQGATASSMSSPTGSASSFNAIQPNIKANQLSQDFVNASNTLAMMADARYKDAQATGQNIDNMYSGALKESQLENLGLLNTAQGIRNEIDFATREDQKQSYRLQNKLADQQIKNYVAQESLIKTQKQLEESKVQLTQEQINEIASVIELNEEMQLTEQSKRQLNKILGNAKKAEVVIGRINANANLINARANEMNARTNQRVGAAQEALLGEEQFGLGLKNQLTKTYGAYSEYWNILNMMENRNKTQWDEAFIWRNIQKLNKDINWYEFDKVFNMMKGGADTGKDLMLLKFLLP